jgi:nucleotide-binding universal stress UspA family protein
MMETEIKVGRRPVVVGYDSSGAGDAAFDWALAEAARRDLPIHVFVARSILYAAAPGIGAASPWPDDLTGELVAEARSYAAAHAPGTTVTIDTATGSPASFLVQASRQAELVVVGRGRHTALGEAVVGSTSAQVAAHASCPVVVVDRGTERPSTAPIVVAVDGSPGSDAALGFAFERASALDAPVVAVHAWWVGVPDAIGVSLLSEDQVAEVGEGAQRLLDDAVSAWVEKYPEVDVRKATVRQLPVEAVLAEAGQAQLIVVGSRGHGGFVGLLLGSVSQALLHHHDRPCPLAVVHTQG